MGQRHQLYVIARSSGRYRVLAAAHHQWLFGRTAIRQCRLIMGILGAESNRVDLLQELRRADQGSWTRLTPEKTAHNSSDNPFSAFRFPFIATCLAIGASVNSELALGASGNARLFQLDLDCDDTANDDGISVFDITNPSQPRYGFVLLRGERDQEIDEEVEDTDADPPYRRRKIINAKTYLCTYYPTEKERLKMDVNDILADLAKRPLISAAALEDIWPDKDWRGGESNALSCEATATSRTSLKEKALAKAVDEAFAGSKEHNGWLWSAEQVPGFSSAVLARLHATPKLLHSPSGMQLLIGALRGRSDVDLRMFRGLKPSDAANILATLRDNQKDGPRALHLSLPDLEGWRVKDLDSVLAAAPVASLSLGETPSMSLAETLASALKHDVKGFISTALYRRPFELSRKRYSEIDALSVSSNSPHLQAWDMLMDLRWPRVLTFFHPESRHHIHCHSACTCAIVARTPRACVTATASPGSSTLMASRLAGLGQITPITGLS